MWSVEDYKSANLLEIGPMSFKNSSTEAWINIAMILIHPLGQSFRNFLVNHSWKQMLNKIDAEFDFSAVHVLNCGFPLSWMINDKCNANHVDIYRPCRHNIWKYTNTLFSQTLMIIITGIVWSTWNNPISHWFISWWWRLRKRWSIVRSINQSI